MKEFWDERYKSSEYVYGITPNEYFKYRITELKPGKLLLPAEGEGRNGVYAASLGWEVTAYDISEEARKKAMTLAADNNVQISYKVDDLINAELGTAEYDAAAMIYMHLNQNDSKIVFPKIIKALKDGGYLIAEVYSKEQINYDSGGPSDLDMLYSTEQLKEDFAGFDIIELNQMYTDLEDNKFHKGKASIIRLFGQKRVLS